MKGLMKRPGVILILLVSTCLMVQPCGASGVNFLRSFPTTSLTKGVTVSATSVFVADGEQGVKIFDAGTPGIPQLGSYDTPGFAFDVVARGDILYVADGNNGLLILDVAQPEAIAPLGHYQTFGMAKSAEMSENYAFLIDYAYGFQIVDVSNPALPCYAGHSADLGDIWTMRMGSDGYLYIADVGNGLRIWDVGDPGRPFEIGRFDTPGYVLDIALSGSLALVADAWNGFLLLDVGDPSSPIELVRIPTSGYAFAIDIVDGFAYLSEGYAGLRIVPLDEFQASQSVGEFNPGYPIYDTATFGKLVVAAAGEAGTIILDVFEAMRPHLSVTMGGLEQVTLKPWSPVIWDVEIDPRSFSPNGFYADRLGDAYWVMVSGNGDIYSLLPGNFWHEGLAPFLSGLSVSDLDFLEEPTPGVAQGLPGACFIPPGRAKAYFGFLSESDDSGDGLEDLFFDFVEISFEVAPPEIRVFGNNDVEGLVEVSADGHISVHASVLPGDYHDAIGDVYVLLVVPEMQLAFWLNDDGRWDSAIVPYRSNALVGSIAALSIFEDIPAGTIPPGEYQFYVGLQLPFDHDCDGAYDLYYSMLRVIVESPSPVIDD
ncbi:MAG: hypothetical protein JRI40_08600 [Deltaproteobacteria bacterium]|nr:hypothetical protein [Deltaproteobacteria bacterium]